MDKILINDTSLRDGNHAVSNNLTLKQIEQYVQTIDASGVDIIEIGHGHGLGGSSLQLGFATASDQEMMRIAKSNMQNAKLCVLILPGLGHINRELKAAIRENADIVRVAAHCTEADITQRHIQYVREHNRIAHGVLVLSHMAPKEKLLEEAEQMVSYGAQAIILMDSAGAYLPDEVQQKVGLLSQNLDVDIGFHAHNNLGLSIANALTAVKAGAVILDATAKGFGAGAGNAPIEVLVAALLKYNYNLSINFDKLLDAIEQSESFLAKEASVIKTENLVSGIYGVFSGFSKHVNRIAEEFDIDYIKIYEELGKRNVVAVQEDVIVEVAQKLKNEESL